MRITYCYWLQQRYLSLIASKRGFLFSSYSEKSKHINAAHFARQLSGTRDVHISENKRFNHGGFNTLLFLNVG